VREYDIYLRFADPIYEFLCHTMIHIEIEPVWQFTRDNDPHSIRLMLDFLNEIRITGKIGHAAEREGMSYRHAWNLIEEWSAFFEAPLVERKQGRGATLTEFGARLVWAGQRLLARLGPQLQNLAQELETEIIQFLPHSPEVIRTHSASLDL
jgi:molybdate transport repressor ModE-like protein